METFSQDIKKIAVFTSGGDAPGMNAAIRAVVRTALYKNLEVYGIYNGFRGMLDGHIEKFDLGSMANIIQRGGTILKSGRCKEFHQKEVRAQAAENLKKHGIDALVCIGGDGSFRGANALWKEHQVPVVGVPGTIDNDIAGTEYSVGFDTAVNTALESIDKIRDTAASHDRLFIVEVMGRNSGFIAVEVGLAGGAEEVFFPENPFNIDRTIDHIENSVKRGKLSSIIVTSEGPEPGLAYKIADQIKSKSGHEAKVCILGHVQRGGSPTAVDRLVASRFGAKAVAALLKKQTGCMVALQNMKYELVSFDVADKKKEFAYNDILELVYVLSQ